MGKVRDPEWFGAVINVPPEGSLLDQAAEIDQEFRVQTVPAASSSRMGAPPPKDRSSSPTGR